MRERYLVALLWLLIFVTGCAQGSYQYGDFSQSKRRPEAIPEKVVVERGGPHKRLDRMSNALSWPRRKMFPELPDRREVTPETLEQVAEYLDKNDLREVRVTVRDYQPREQWRRLRESRVVPPLARYTFGSLSVVGYTLFPGKLFDRNSYNPYTDTLYVNSESPALLVHEAAFAKNIRQRSMPGAYAVVSELPFLHAWSSIDSTREVVGYAQAEENWKLEQRAYEQIYPKVGTEAIAGAGVFLPVWWAIPAVGLAGGVAGGATGKAALARREAERADIQNQLVEREVMGREVMGGDAPKADVQQASFNEPADTPRRRYVTASPNREPNE